MMVMSWFQKLMFWKEKPINWLGRFPGRWGNNIVFWHDREDEVYGWLPRPVQDGDYFSFKMQSGAWGVYRLIGVRRCDDPPDMFFATVEAVCYEREWEHVALTSGHITDQLTYGRPY